MKPTSIQPNDSQSLGDDLYSIYHLELNTRGYGYFGKLSLLPTFTSGEVSMGLLDAMLIKLALNKSIVAIMLDANPRESINTMLFDGLTENQINYLTDFLDDITLNVRLRNSVLYDRNKEIILEHIRSIAEDQTLMTKEQKEAFDTSIKFFSPLILTFHYLRKVGYNVVLKQPQNISQE